MQAKHLNTKTEVGVRLNINSGCVKLSVPRFWTIGRDSVPLVGAVECALDLHSVPISSCHHRYLTQLKSEPEAKKQTPDQQYPILLFFFCFALLYYEFCAHLDETVSSHCLLSLSMDSQHVCSAVSASVFCCSSPSSCLPLEPIAWQRINPWRSRGSWQHPLISKAVLS